MEVPKGPQLDTRSLDEESIMLSLNANPVALPYNLEA